MNRCHWPPSVSRDDGCTRVGHFWLLHLLVWLCMPMREWQSLPHRRQVSAVAACSVRLDLWAALFFLWQSVRSCSACFVSDCTAARQESQHYANAFPRLDAYCRALHFPLSSTFVPESGAALGSWSSPYSRSLGMRPSSMRRT